MYILHGASFSQYITATYIEIAATIPALFLFHPLISTFSEKKIIFCGGEKTLTTSGGG